MKIWRPRFKSRRTRRVKLEHEKVPIQKRTRILVGLLLAALILASSILFFPLEVAYDPPAFVEGAVSGEEVIAPFSFDVMKFPEEFELEQARAAEGVLPTFVAIRRGPVFEPILNRLDQVRGNLRSLRSILDSLYLGLDPATVTLLASPDSGGIVIHEARRLLDQARTLRLVGEADAHLIRSYSRVHVGDAEGETTLQTNQILDLGRLSDRAWERGMEHLGSRGADALADLVGALAAPNLAYDHAATEASRETARESVSPHRATILKGERIIDANERITPDQLVLLESLQDALVQRSTSRGLRAWLLPVLGRALLVGVFLTLITGFLRGVRPAIWNDLGHLTLLSSVTILTLALAGIIIRSTTLHEFLVPVPFAAVVVTLLIGNLSALGLVLGISALIGVLSGAGLSLALIGAVGGVIACYSVQHVFHRMEFLRSIIPITLGMISVMLGLHLVGVGTPWKVLIEDMAWLAGNAALSIALAMFMLPLFEKVFGLASNITLLELSDLNRPIFKRMMLEANGTYHHSMIVGSLAEAAAERVGANPMLCRVGGYYHDIGKIAKSGYFGENLRGGLRNPHEKLTPHMSSLILESHVRDGLEMAKEIGLPGKVAAFIPEHQGTTLMQYFYNKALELDPEVEELDYRYPGPRPQTKETGIVMLADASEAIVRSLDDHSPKMLRAALSRLFEARISDGQLDDCGLSMRDLKKIREAFTHVLTGVFHGRIKYQWQKGDGEKALGESKGPRVFHPELETAIGTRESPSGFTGSSPTSSEIK